MSKQDDFLRPEKPLEKTQEIDNEARISKKAEMKKKINRNQKRITVWDIQLSSLISLEKIKNQNAYPRKLNKKLTVPPFHFQKCVDQKYLWRSWNYKEPSKSNIRFLTIFFRNLGKWKRQKVKNSIFDDPLIVNQPFSQTKYTIGKSDFAHIMHFH